MVFSSVPVYLDPPNWQQQNPINGQPGRSSSSNNPDHFSPCPQQAPAGGGGGSMIRPGSMAERARLAKLPQPEAALKCPRCESTNTKFCYYNNYSLTQPRHFCKTCRRYWTIGGALRNVPVGGGCRRNNKKSKSKSPSSSNSRSLSASATNRQTGSATSSSSSAVASSSCTSTVDQSYVMSHIAPPQLPFVASLHLSDYEAADVLGLNFTGDGSAGTGSTAGDMEFPMASNSGGNILSSGDTERWRVHQAQQIPFLTGLEPPSMVGLYPFEAQGGGDQPPIYAGGAAAQFRPKLPSGFSTGGSGSGFTSTQIAPVKTEANQGLYLSRQQLLGIRGNDHQHQYYGRNAWTDFSGFNSSSTNHLL